MGSIQVSVSSEFEDLVPEYLAERRRDVDDMLALLATSDFERLRTFGHNLIGNGRSYGFGALSTMGAELEASAKIADKDSLEWHLERIADYLARVELVFDQSHRAA